MPANKPLEWTGHLQLSALSPQAPCLPPRGSVAQRYAQSSATKAVQTGQRHLNRAICGLYGRRSVFLSRKSTHACGKLARGLIFLQTPKERLKDMVRLGRSFPCGLPGTHNVNYLWIQLFLGAERHRPQ